MRNFFFTLIFLTFLPLNGVYASDTPLKVTGKNTLKFMEIKKSIGFALPIDCTLGEDCHIMNYVDFAPNDGKKTDPACLERTYDGHKGTDFALFNEKSMKEGVDVLAPMGGVVTKIRDGEPDQWSTPDQLEAIKTARKECGNAIMIDHGHDIQTIYCHLKKGSITVKANQKIKEGQKIAQVGLSGLTEFPHLHFGILKNKKIIDPFTGKDNFESCGKTGKPLWKKELDVHYQHFMIQTGGFLDDIPTLNKIDKDRNHKDIISPDANIITFWTTLLGVRNGDIINLDIKDPNGKILSKKTFIQEKNRARQFYYIGQNLEDKTLMEGAYIATVKIERQSDKNKTIEKQKIFTTLVVK